MNHFQPYSFTVTQCLKIFMKSRNPQMVIYVIAAVAAASTETQFKFK
jgi:hypothetical protein